MRNKRVIGLAAVSGALIVGVCAERLLGGPAQVGQTARCTVVAPKGWGEHVGAGSYSLEFKDDAGTLRFVKQFACGTEAAPNISLEVRRR